jgi:hypothetical protein
VHLLLQASAAAGLLSACGALLDPVDEGTSGGGRREGGGDSEGEGGGDGGGTQGDVAVGGSGGGAVGGCDADDPGSFLELEPRSPRAVGLASRDPAVRRFFALRGAFLGR